MLTLFLKGLLIGFAIAAPVDPIGVLCIQRSLHNGFKVGLMTGLGAALADGAYGLIAGFWLTAISSLLIKYQFWIRVIGGLFLLYLGTKLVLTPARGTSTTTNFNKSSLHACAITFPLTLTNPATILSFMAVFAGFGIGTMKPDFIHALILVLGITLGSAAWWLLLSGGVVFILHKRVGSTFLWMINLISGFIIFGFGIFALKAFL